MSAPPYTPEAEAPATIAAQMDMSSELANQAAAEAAVAAAINHANNHTHTHSHNTHAHTPAPPHAHAHAHAHAHSHGAHGAHARSESSSASAAPHGTALSASTSPGPQPGQGPPPPAPYRRPAGAFPFGPPHRQAPDSPLSNAQQLVILREFYARNPNPGRRELEHLAERTGRPWNKIREYFRQRRNKLRGLADLESMDEPGRATGWLQVSYRPQPGGSVSQLALYNAYRSRFDPYASSAPLLGGQELIQLACATFPGCEMARDEGDYVLRGLRDKEGGSEEWDRNVDALVEPLRSTTWLLSNFQHQSEPGAPSITQTELYSSYAARFLESAAAAAQGEDDELKDFEANMAAGEGEGEAAGGSSGSGDADGANGADREHSVGGAGGSSGTEGVGVGGVSGVDGVGVEGVPVSNVGQEIDDINSFLPPAPDSPPAASSHDAAEGERKPARLLNPVELISLTRMTFPKAEPAVDDEGRFVIRGIERRDGVEKGRPRTADMFPFALAQQPAPSDAAHPFTALLKRKLALLDPDPEQPRKRAAGIGVNIAPAPEPEHELSADERELLDGLRRFRSSALGKEVRDVCVQQ